MDSTICVLITTDLCIYWFLSGDQCHLNPFDLWHQSLYPEFWLQPMYTLCYSSSLSCKSEGQECVCSLLQACVYSK